MVTYFNKKDLVSFGNYLLSEQREQIIKESPSTLPYEERKKQVYHADVENWKHSINKE